MSNRASHLIRGIGSKPPAGLIGLLRRRILWESDGTVRWRRFILPRVPNVIFHIGETVMRSRRFIPGLLCAFASAAAAAWAAADVLRVPGDYPNIRAAIEAAAANDTVLVADGIYIGPGNTDLILHSAITVRSENGPERCTIDCENEGWGFSFEPEMPEDTIVVDGFTILRARASAVRGWGADKAFIRNCAIRDCDDRAAVSVRITITIENCLIEGNREGGYYADWARLHMQDCVVRGNRSSLFGGGIRLDDGISELVGCTIQANRSDFGGGIHNRGRMVLRDCLIAGNQAANEGGAASGGDLEYLNCRIARNKSGEGGALRTYGRVVVDRCILIDNEAVGGGGAMMLLSNDAAITNSVLRGNRAGVDSDWPAAGGALYLAGGSPRIVNCTFTQNDARQGGGAIYCDESRPTLVDCVFWNDAPDEILLHGASSAELSYCVVSGGWPGVGNMDRDPRFEAGAGGTRLSSESPCINAGDPAWMPVGSFDIDGEARIMGGRVDIGADEFPGRPFLFGDMDCDGARDSLDIVLFVTAIVDPAGYAMLQPGCSIANGDLNSDGAVDAFDIEPFMRLITDE
jgi:predicted outer membrane repeat protein